jgi:ABC-type uncharacterized transport system
MALNEDKKPADVAAAAAAPTPQVPSTGAPVGPARSTAPSPYLAFLGPIYALALVLVFIGERVVSSDGMRLALSCGGMLVAVAVTVLRFVWTQDTPGERRSSERALSLLFVLGLCAIAIYFADNTDAGRKLLGLTSAMPDTRARVDGALTVLWIGLLMVSVVPLLFGELAIAPMRRAPRPEVRRVHAAIAAGFTVAFALVYCALFTYAAGELDYKADFSYYRAARPGDSTRNIAASLTEPVKVRAFFPQLNDVGAEVDGYLRDLAKASPNMQVETYDRLMSPGVAKDAKVNQDGVLVLTRGESNETLSIGTEMKTALPKLKSLDGDFQKALLKVMRSARIAYLTVGHGEISESGTPGAAEGRSAKNLRKLLESQNYAVKELGLAQGLGTEIPADATFVAVIGPSQAFLPEEVTALRKYAEKGGHLLLALDPDAKVDLGPLAAVAGLTWSKTLLANDKVYLRHRFNNSDRTILVTNRFSSHASVSTLSRNSSRTPVVFPGSSSLDKREGSDQEVDFTVRTLPDTFDDQNGDFELTAGSSEKRSTWNIAAAVSKSLPPIAGKKEGEEMRAFVVADADAVSDAAFGNEPNILFIIDVIRWLGGEESFSGSINSSEDVRIEHTKEKDRLWFYGTIAGAPALVLALGLVATRRKRPRVVNAKVVTNASKEKQS